ncbi:MAG: apolipoprotein N-acyltransferase [Treponema sp.]|nr:apolipoprotein N-acyltransferase [Treponema sp.]
MPKIKNKLIIKPAQTGLKKIFFVHLGLILLSSLLFTLSFPNPLFTGGVFFLAWFAFVPLLIVIKKSSLLFCAGWGLIYGFMSYFLFNYWLGNFHPLAGTLVYTIYSVYLSLVFVLLKLTGIFFEKRAYLVQWIIWLSYEYLKTTGFLGYPYGVIGYSQWQIIPLIQIAGITGVWGISALVTFPSFWLSEAISKKEDLSQRHKSAEDTEKNKGGKSLYSKLLDFFFVFLVPQRLCVNSSRIKVSAIIWLAALIAALFFGFINMKDFSAYPSAQIALIQHNTDPWQASRAPTPWLRNEAYRKDLNTLSALSDEALVSTPKPQLVVWPETAFIPRIYWHTTHRDDQNSWAIVRDLLSYLSKQDVPFLIGNDDARIEPAINPDENNRHRVDYNAAMLFENGINTAAYRKLHLVPFTEHFPYKKQFPWIYNWLVNQKTTFWEKGREETIFSVNGFTFAAPICFEDTFGYLSRNFVRNGAGLLVNLSNDAWSNSLSAQYQHLTMAVFRTVENNRSMVRSTSSGQTCAIDPNGRIIAMAAPFTETWLNISVPLAEKTTIYTLYGDFLAVLFVILAVILLLSGAFYCTMKKLKSRGQS